MQRCQTQPFSRVAPLLVLSCLLLGSGHAQAYDLSRQRDPGPQAGGRENVFIDGAVGLWLPGPLTFDDNHTLSLAFAAEVGVTVLSLARHQLLIVGGFSLSPQTLEAHLDEASTTLLQGFGGLRYVPGVTCMAGGAGCAFLELSLGLTWETAEDQGAHGSPKGELTLNLGAGYRFNLGRHLHLGGRIDLGYLEESRSREIGWFIPALFAGVSF